MSAGTLASSCLSQADYNSETEVLTLGFQSGGIYEYAGVSFTLFMELLAAPSRGQFFHQEIRNNYPYQRVAAPESWSGPQEAPMTVWLSGGPTGEQAKELAAHNARCTGNWALGLDTPPTYAELVQALSTLAGLVTIQLAELPVGVAGVLQGAVKGARELVALAKGEVPLLTG